MEKRKVYDARTRRLVGAELRRLYEDGASITDLAAAIGRSTPYARKLLLEAGTTLRSALPRKAGPPVPRTHSPLRATLRAYYEDGASVRDLARLTGRSYGSVHRLLLEAGTALRGRGGDHSKQWQPPAP